MIDIQYYPKEETYKLNGITAIGWNSFREEFIKSPDIFFGVDVKDIIDETYPWEQFIKQMHGILEKFRVEVRQIRHQYLESVKTDRQSGKISEDDEEREKHEIQKLHDEYIEVIEVAGKIKEEQLREV